MVTKLYIAAYEDRAAVRNYFWDGSAWVTGLDNAKEFPTQGTARKEGLDAIAVYNLNPSLLKVRTLQRGYITN